MDSSREFQSDSKKKPASGPAPEIRRSPVILPPENSSLKPSPHGPHAFKAGTSKESARSTTADRQAASVAQPTPPQQASPPQSGLGGLYFLLATASLMFGIWFVGPRLVEEYFYAAEMGRSRAEYETAVEQLDKQPLSQVSHAYKLVAQRIRPSVVSVNAIKSSGDSLEITAQGLGSGVILSEDGYIITNAHVLEGASSYFVELYDRRQFQAALVGRDEISDLAVLKIDAPKLIPATWGDSDEIDVGSIVWAIGSPYGFEQTVTSGIVSGKNRKGDPTEKYNTQSLIQTDAAVNPGNSGGPLVDAQGRVVGINTSIFGKTFQGISFAVPSDTARFVFHQLVENGRVIRGYLGVIPSEVEYRDLVNYELPDLDGAKLTHVEYGSPAADAGIRPNDIIRSWGGNMLKDYRNLYRLTEKTPPNSMVNVTLLRNGEEVATRVKVGLFRER